MYDIYIYISVTFLLFLYLSLDAVRKQLEGVKGQGPGEQVTSQETAQLKLGLRLAFTVKMVNLRSPHRPLRKHMLCLSASVSRFNKLCQPHKGKHASP